MSTDYTPIQVPQIPPVASFAAHRRLADDLVARGMPPAVAAAISGAVVDPGQVRRRLTNPDAQRTSAGELLTVSGRVWMPRISAHPDNKRETAQRYLPISGVTLDHQVLPELTSEGDDPYLRLEADDPRQLVAALQKAEVRLLTENSLVDRIEEEGILRPLTITGVIATFESGDGAVAMVTSDDGSSRTSSSHRILGIDPNEVLYRYTTNDRVFRRYVGDLRQRLERGDQPVGEADLKAARALVAPAEIIVGFRPVGAGSTMARATRALVGLLHVLPAKPWKPASALDAQGEEVVDELLSSGAISEDEARLMTGLMTLDEAAEKGLADHHDERAGVILRVFAAHHGAARRAIRRVTHLASTRDNRLIHTAVELAIRSFRTGTDSPDAVHTSRVGLQLAYEMPEIIKDSWDVTKRSPEALRDAALAEFEEAGDKLGPGQIELAVLGGYHLARARVLTQYSMRKESDVKNLSSPSTLLRRLVTTRRGILTLYQGLKMGRKGARAFPVVDETGDLEVTRSGDQRAMTNDWLRREWAEPGEADIPSPASGVQTAASLYAARQEAIARTIHGLAEHEESLAAILDEAGRPMIEVQGWSGDEVEPLIRKLSAVEEGLREAVWAHRRAHPEPVRMDEVLPIDDAQEVSA